MKTQLIGDERKLERHQAGLHFLARIMDCPCVSERTEDRDEIACAWELIESLARSMELRLRRAAASA